jgi:hypothetical protein
MDRERDGAILSLNKYENETSRFASLLIFRGGRKIKSEMGPSV